jgi:predicted DNA-binding transcriptional regulator AlpA
MRLLTFTDLKQQKGIPYCRDHLRRKVNAGEFPKPVSIGPASHPRRRVAWVEEEVDAYLEEIAAQRFGLKQPVQAAAPIAASTARPRRSPGGGRRT